jgi:tRNA threonylcarbamoyladenosine biosynthesis protein TsaE
VSTAVAMTVVEVPTADAMRTLGLTVGALLRAGDLVVLTGDLGAGKTTFAQGVGAALGVRGAVTSPTFVIAREHPSLGAGPPLVHADAYRLGGVAEVDDLDLDASLEEAVTLVEWGEGFVEGLAADRLEVRLHRPRGGGGSGGGGLGADGAGTGGTRTDGAGAGVGDEPRTVTLVGVGDRWRDVPLPGGTHG